MKDFKVVYAKWSSMTQNNIPGTYTFDTFDTHSTPFDTFQ